MKKLLLTLAAYLGLAGPCSAELPNKCIPFSRYILTSINNSPFPPNGSTFTDPNHEDMEAQPYYKIGDGKIMDDWVEQELLTFWGLDFRVCDPNPTNCNPNVIKLDNGIRLLFDDNGNTVATWLPFVLDLGLFVVTDSAHPRRGRGQCWEGKSYGVFVLLSQEFPVPSSAKNYPQVLQPGDLFHHEDLNLLWKAPSGKVSRELITCANIKDMTKQLHDDLGSDIYFLSLSIVNTQDEELGYCLGATTVTYDSNHTPQFIQSSEALYFTVPQTAQE